MPIATHRTHLGREQRRNWLRRLRLKSTGKYDIATRSWRDEEAQAAELNSVTGVSITHVITIAPASAPNVILGRSIQLSTDTTANWLSSMTSRWKRSYSSTEPFYLWRTTTCLKSSLFWRIVQLKIRDFNNFGISYEIWRKCVFEISHHTVHIYELRDFRQNPNNPQQTVFDFCLKLLYLSKIQMK